MIQLVSQKVHRDRPDEHRRQGHLAQCAGRFSQFFDADNAEASLRQQCRNGGLASAGGAGQRQSEGVLHESWASGGSHERIERQAQH